MNKIKDLLGTSRGAANHVLTRDLLFYFIEHDGCYRCGKPLTRKTFSIDHRIDWLNHKNGKKLFFDLENIAFSHASCNLEAMLIQRRKTADEKRELRTKYQREYRMKNPVVYDPEARKRHHLKTGN